MKVHLRRSVVVAITVAAAIAAAGPFAYSAVTADGTITACAKNESGQLRLDGGSGCLPSEVPVQWSKTGPQGLQGPPGPPGPTEAHERFFARNLADPGSWLPVVSGVWPDIRPHLTHVLTLHLAPGNYTVTGEVIAGNSSGTGVMVCLLGTSAAGFAVAQSGVGSAPGFSIQQTLEAQGIFALPQGGDLELSCFNAPPFEPQGNPAIGYADVIATKVDTIASTQES